jgi:hypothetical protein
VIDMAAAEAIVPVVLQVYRSEKEESETLERFRLMRRGEAREALKAFLRNGQVDMAFDLVYKNPYAARYVVADKELASIEGKNWTLGHHAVWAQLPARLYILERPHSDVARLRVNPKKSKWLYSIIEQARRAT